MSWENILFTVLGAIIALLGKQWEERLRIGRERKAAISKAITGLLNAYKSIVLILTYLEQGYLPLKSHLTEDECKAYLAYVKNLMDSYDPKTLKDQIDIIASFDPPTANGLYTYIVMHERMRPMLDVQIASTDTLIRIESIFQKFYTDLYAVLHISIEKLCELYGPEYYDKRSEWLDPEGVIKGLKAQIEHIDQDPDLSPIEYFKNHKGNN